MHFTIHIFSVLGHFLQMQKLRPKRWNQKLHVSIKWRKKMIIGSNLLLDSDAGLCSGSIVLQCADKSDFHMIWIYEFVIVFASRIAMVLLWWGILQLLAAPAKSLGGSKNTENILDKKINEGKNREKGKRELGTGRMWSCSKKFCSVILWSFPTWGQYFPMHSTLTFLPWSLSHTSLS